MAWIQQVLETTHTDDDAEDDDESSFFALDDDVEYAVVNNNEDVFRVKGCHLKPGFSCPGCKKHFCNVLDTRKDKKGNKTTYLTGRLRRRYSEELHSQIISSAFCIVSCGPAASFSNYSSQRDVIRSKRRTM